jgi:hypothetical protein
MNNTIIELNMNGEMIRSNNIPKFANSKDQAKEILGSSYKTRDNKLLIADSINKKAIIVDMDSNQIIWEYNSSRYIVDFQLDDNKQKTINIYDWIVSPDKIYSNENKKIVWINNSSIPLTIYSGYINEKIWQEHNDLSDYGSEFKSHVVPVGGKYDFIFSNIGTYYWFTYPTLLNGIIYITKQRLSDQDEYYILESDGLDSPFSSRLIKVDSWGNVLWSFGEGYLVKPRDIRPLLNNNLLIST